MSSDNQKQKMFEYINKMNEIRKAYDNIAYINHTNIKIEPITDEVDVDYNTKTI